MRFVVAGAGAIGAYLGARMTRAGYDVTLFARGPHLRAIEANGVRVCSAEGDFEAHPESLGRSGIDRTGRRRLSGGQGAQPGRSRAPIEAAIRPRDHGG